MRFRNIARIALGAAIVLSSSYASYTHAEELSALVDSIGPTLDAEEASVRGAKTLPRWLDGVHAWYVDPTDDSRLLILDASRNEERVLLDLNRLRHALKRPDGEKLGLTGLELVSNHRVLLRLGDRKFVVDRESYAIQESVEKEDPLRAPQKILDRFPYNQPPLFEVPSPDGGHYVTVKGGNLALRPAGSIDVDLLTHDAEPGLDWAGGSTGTLFDVAFSPNGTYLAATRADTRSIRPVPLLRGLDNPPTVDVHPVMRVDQPLPRLHVAIFALRSRKQLEVALSDVGEAHVSILGWSEDSAELYLMRTSRDFKHVQYLSADPTTGVVRILLTQSSQTFVATPATASTRMFFPVSHGFVLLAEDEGALRLYLHDRSGRRVRALSDLGSPVTDVTAVDERGGFVYYRSSDPNRPYDRRLWRTRISCDGTIGRSASPGCPAQLLTLEPGFHAVAPSPSKRFFIDVSSTPMTPPEVRLRSIDGRIVREISRADIRTLVSRGWSPPEPFSVPTIDGRFDNRGLILKPQSFDASRRYPVVELIYGGMQSIVMPPTFVPLTSRDNIYFALSRLLTQRGFIVVHTQSPGSPYRGKAYQDATYGTWPQSVIPNHAHTLRTLAATRPWMDLDRVGIAGYSWGGYMTQRAMLEAPELYRTGVALMPVSDMYDHIYYIEPFLGLMSQNRAGYENASNLSRASRLQGRLLLVSGLLDVNASFSATVKMVNALAEAKKSYDLVILPRGNHDPSCCGAAERDYVYAVTIHYLEETLRTDSARKTSQ